MLPLNKQLLTAEAFSVAPNIGEKQFKSRDVAEVSVCDELQRAVLFEYIQTTDMQADNNNNNTHKRCIFLAF